jgi:hypothetical protein
VSQQIELVNSQTQFRKLRRRRRIAPARLHPSLRPAKTITQGTRFIGITQFEQKPTYIVCFSTRLLY